MLHESLPAGRVHAVDLEEEVAQALRLHHDSRRNNAVYISASQSAAVRIGDLVIAVNGQSTSNWSAAQTSTAIERCSGGIVQLSLLTTTDMVDGASSESLLSYLRQQSPRVLTRMGRALGIEEGTALEPQLLLLIGKLRDLVVASSHPDLAAATFSMSDAGTSKVQSSFTKRLFGGTPSKEKQKRKTEHIGKSAHRNDEMVVVPSLLPDFLHIAEQIFTPITHQYEKPRKHRRTGKHSRRGRTAVSKRGCSSEVRSFIKPSANAMRMYVRVLQQLTLQHEHQQAAAMDRQRETWKQDLKRADAERKRLEKEITSSTTRLKVGAKACEALEQEKGIEAAKAKAAVGASQREVIAAAEAQDLALMVENANFANANREHERLQAAMTASKQECDRLKKSLNFGELTYK